MSIVRQNLLKDPTYAPYCLNCRAMPRMAWNGGQFRCTSCGEATEFDAEFVARVIAFRQSAVAQS